MNKSIELKANKDKLSYVGKKPGYLNENERNSDSWFTPKSYVELIRNTLGGSIDFDPFSNNIAQRTVKAQLFYTAQDNALTTPWPKCITVFMNPPYSRGFCGLAVRAFIVAFDSGKFTRGIVLVNNATDTKWWEELTNHAGCVALCLTHGRIGFENSDGKAVSGNTRGQAFILYQTGEQREKTNAIAQFKTHFDNVVGKVWVK